LILLNLLPAVSDPERHPGVLRYLCELACSPDTSTLIQTRVFATLTPLAERPSVADVLIQIQQDLNFDQLFLATTDLAQHSRILQFFLPLLPSHRMLEPLGLPRNPRSSHASDFAIKVQGTLEKVLIQRPLSLCLTLLAFAATVAARKTPLTDAILASLMAFCIRPEGAPFVLGILCLYGDAERDICSQILDRMRTVRVSDRIQRWYSQGFEYLRRRIGDVQDPDYSQLQLNDFDTLARDKSLNWFSFLNCGGIERCCELLRQNPKAVTEIPS
jgi:hypothetical protein